jgi:hypothetical protein
MFKNLNYTSKDAPDYEPLQREITELADSCTAIVATSPKS